MADSEKLIEEISSFCDQYQLQYESIITSRDVIRLMKSLGPQADNNEFKRIFDKLNMSGDGTMPLNEFIKTMLEKVLELENVNNLRKDFKTIDTKGKGYITAKQLYQVLQDIETDVSLGELEQLLRVLDNSDKGDKLHYNRFLDDLTKH